MSTKIQDFANNAVLKDAMASGPAVVTSTITGATLDMLLGDNRCFAIQSVGAIVGATPTLAGKIQEGSKSDASDMADISGATFTSVNAAQNLQSINFDRTKRYVRYIGTVALNGGTSIAVDALIGEQQKQV